MSKSDSVAHCIIFSRFPWKIIGHRGFFIEEGQALLFINNACICTSDTLYSASLSFRIVIVLLLNLYKIPVWDYKSLIKAL